MMVQQGEKASPGPPSTPLPITTSTGMASLDQFKYLRSLLPPSQPCSIDRLTFNHINSWDCVIYVALVSESDCLKWLSDFEDKTKIGWKVDSEASKKTGSPVWAQAYRCQAAGCGAALNMRILAPEEQGRKKYPCMVSITYQHAHLPPAGAAPESYKAHEVPSHIKEGFEGYFQDTMSPVESGQTAQGQGNVRSRLEEATRYLLSVLEGGGPGARAVTQWLDSLERVREDPAKLQAALNGFGGEALSLDWLVGEGGEVPGQERVQVILQPESPPLAGTGARGRRAEEVLVTESLPSQQVVQAAGQVVQPSCDTPEPDLKRRKRNRCGSCAGCRNSTKDCRACRNCLDQKRYGGPGRLKKACVKRQCAIISQLELGQEEPAACSPLPAVKSEPQGQETAVTLAARSEPSPAGAHTVSLVGAGGQTVSLLSGPGGQGQTFTIGGQTYSLVGSPSAGQAVSIGSQPVSLATAPSPAPAPASPSGLQASTLLSWPSSQYAPTFQVQQQPVQFVFQTAQGFSSPSGQPIQVQYTAPSQQLESLVTEASQPGLPH